MKLTNVLLDGILSTVEWQNGKLTGVRAGCEAGAGLDGGGRKLIPGLIDIHFHGALGIDSLDGDLEPLSAYLAANGITAWLPTLSTAEWGAMLRAAGAPRPRSGARVLGIHFEGPFLSYGKRGAQDPAWLKQPDPALLQQIPDLALLTVAPEVPGAMDMIRAAECPVSLGHTECDYETASAAFEAGANCLTHTFNAMPPLLHRAPGPIGAALTHRAYAQMICDGVHVHPAAVLAGWKMFGPDRMALISDSIREAGVLHEGPVGDRTVRMMDGALRLPDGTIAGSGVTLRHCVEQAIRFGIPEAQAVQMASATPAELLGVPKGRIAPGFDADLVLLGEDGLPDTVIIGGEPQPIDRSLQRKL